jgi:hypothetical protein
MGGYSGSYIASNKVGIELFNLGFFKNASVLSIYIAS